MKTNEQKRHSRAKTGRGVVRDWQPLFARFQEAIEWALDIAVKLARGYHDEIDAIERVRGYFGAWIDGRRVEIDTSDVFTTLAILFAAIELDIGIDSSPILRPLHGFPKVIHLPGAAHDEEPTVVIRRPRRLTRTAA